jgi:hypothetical protein
MRKLIVLGVLGAVFGSLGGLCQFTYLPAGVNPIGILNDLLSGGCLLYLSFDIGRRRGERDARAVLTEVIQSVEPLIGADLPRVRGRYAEHS